MKNQLTLSKTATASIDNTRTFEDKSLNELYVTWWEIAAKESKKVLDLSRHFKVLTINVIEKHPQWHISFASSYKDRGVFTTLTLDEVEQRTEDDNWLNNTAWFSLDQVKDHLRTCIGNSQMLWPDHSLDWQESIELMTPLTNDDFDITIAKWQDAAKEAYSGFDWTELDETLKQHEIETLILIWVATDYCVWKTAIDARAKWYNVYIVSEAVAGVAPETTEAKINEMKELWIIFITKQELLELFENAI